jgi:YHS domain-containing protein
MNNEKPQLKIFLLLTGLLMTGLIVLNSCKKKAEPVNPEIATSSIAAIIEQTTCPVMGGAINKNFYAEYKGKKVYFCCPTCKGEFEKNPEKYISKLPQFAK